MLNSFDKEAYHKAHKKLTNHAKSALFKATEIAHDLEYGEIGNSHLLFAIFAEKGSVGSSILTDFGLSKEAFQKLLKENSPGLEDKVLAPSAGLKKTLVAAFSIAKDFGYSYVGTEHLAYALLGSNDKIINEILSKAEIKKTKQAIKSLFEPDQLSQISKLFNIPETIIHKQKAGSSSPTPFIDKFCTNVNVETENKKEIVIGREKEIDRIINILGRKNKNNPLLVGDPGVGKTALISGLANLINAGNVPASLYGRRIMNLDIAQLIAGTSFRGEFESRLKEIIKEASTNKDVILFIDEIHNIVGAGNVAGSLDLANIIKPALARGEIQLIGATTFAEYKKHIEKDAALERRFQPVHIKESTMEETKKILLGIKENYEEFHNVSISAEAIALAIELSVQYIQNRFLPDKAIDVIDETASNIRSRFKVSDFLKKIKELEKVKTELFSKKERLVSDEDYEQAIELRRQEKELEEKIKTMQQDRLAAEKKRRIEIQTSDIIETISKISGVPMEKLSQEKNVKIKNIQKILDAQIIGQKEAMEKLSNTLLRAQSGIANPDRPIGSFLFLGPTGVGKTLTAKILAQEFFGNPKALIKIDMSELMERHSVSALIGSPAGYIGYGEGGNLTEKVRRNPYSVILFDEIEKAHPDVHNILLQILEDGVLTDAEGTQVSFKNTIIILTSNTGTDEFTNASKVGFESESHDRTMHEKFNQIKNNVIKELERKMKPELINRLDYILVFNSLDTKDLQRIAKLELEKLSRRVAKKDIRLVFDKKVSMFIAEKSLAFNQGARLVRKNIQEMIENPAAEMIVYGKMRNNNISATVEKDKLKII